MALLHSLGRKISVRQVIMSLTVLMGIIAVIINRLSLAFLIRSLVKLDLVAIQIMEKNDYRPVITFRL